MGVYILIIILWIVSILCGFVIAFAINPDYILHHSEYKNKGSIGERNLYLVLRQNGVLENQIFRNVYIEKEDGTTAEMDLIVLSKKAVFVFEVKNYSGKIYGDTKYAKWIQYFHGKKNYFLSPILQNKDHIVVLQKFLDKYKNLRIIPVEVATTNAKWLVKNIQEDDNFITNGDFAKKFPEIYNSFDTMKMMDDEFNEIREKLAEHSRPNEKIREQHIEEIKAKYD